MFQFLENLFGFAFNAWRNRCEKRRQNALEAAHRSRPLSVAPLAPDAVVLGHIVPLEAPRGKEAIADSGVTKEVVALSALERRVHIHVLGRSGGGKTNLLLSALDFDIARCHTCCVVDCRGDLVERILHRLAHSETPEGLRERLVLIDLRETSHIVGFNPLGAENGGDPYSRAYHLMGIVREQSDSWGVQLEETLRNCLIALAMTGWTLLEIEPLLTDPAFRSHVMSQVSARSVHAFFERYSALSNDKQTAWRLPVLNKITPLTSSFPALRLMLGQRQGFSFRHLLDEQPGSIILISLAQDRLQGAAHLVGGLLLSAFETAIMARVEQPEAARVPCYLYLDELQNIVTQRFESLIAEGRRLGVSCCLSHQNLGQLPPYLRQLLRVNVGTTICLGTGAGDASEMEKEFLFELPEDSKPPNVRALLMNLPTGQAIVARRNRPAVRIQIPHQPDPKVEAQFVQQLRETSWAAHARPSTELEQEMAQRETNLMPQNEPTADVTPRSRTRKTAAPRVAKTPDAPDRNKPIYEVRHDKTANFKSDDKTSGKGKKPKP